MAGTSPAMTTWGDGGGWQRGARAGGANVLRHRPRIVMPGLVPGIHVGPPLRSLPARTSMRQDVDGRNESGHDGGG